MDVPNFVFLFFSVKSRKSSDQYLFILCEQIQFDRYVVVLLTIFADGL